MVFNEGAGSQSAAMRAHHMVLRLLSIKLVMRLVRYPRQVSG